MGGHTMTPPLNRLQRITLTLTGRTLIGHKKNSGWRGFLPVYAFKCPKHGIVESPPQGYSQRLECPKCHKEGNP